MCLASALDQSCTRAAPPLLRQGAVEVVPGIYHGGEAAAVAAVRNGQLPAGSFKFFCGVSWSAKGSDDCVRLGWRMARPHEVSMLVPLLLTALQAMVWQGNELQREIDRGAW